MVLALCGLSSQSIGQILQVDRLKASYLVGFIDFARMGIRVGLKFHDDRRAQRPRSLWGTQANRPRSIE